MRWEDPALTTAVLPHPLQVLPTLESITLPAGLVQKRLGLGIATGYV